MPPKPSGSNLMAAAGGAIALQSINYENSTDFQLERVTLLPDFDRIFSSVHFRRDRLDSGRNFAVSMAEYAACDVWSCGREESRPHDLSILYIKMEGLNNWFIQITEKIDIFNHFKELL